MIELLISKGADLNKTCGSLSRTALLHSIERDNDKIAELLIQHGADIEVKDKLGKNALYLAAKMKNEEIADLLISHGAKTCEKDNDGISPLHVAAKSVVRMLRNSLFCILQMLMKQIILVGLYYILLHHPAV